MNGQKNDLQLVVTKVSLKGMLMTTYISVWGFRLC